MLTTNWIVILLIRTYNARLVMLHKISRFVRNKRMKELTANARLVYLMLNLLHHRSIKFAQIVKLLRLFKYLNAKLL